MGISLLLCVEGNRGSEGEVEGGVGVGDGACDEFDGRCFVVECVVTVASALCRLDPGLDGVAPSCCS